MNDDELSDQIRNNATRYKAREHIRASVRTQLALQSATRPDPLGLVATVARRLRYFQWPGILSGFAIGVALTVALAFVLPRTLARESLPNELVTSHVRSLKAGSLIAVASSDRHTVKPWFQGKLDYAPPVFNLEADGFPLLGGRIEHLYDGPVAVLAYTSRLHKINVFVWPINAQPQVQQRWQRNGFNLVHWNHGDMQLWAVSDLDVAELDRFVQTWQTRDAAP